MLATVRVKTAWYRPEQLQGILDIGPSRWRTWLEIGSQFVICGCSHRLAIARETRHYREVHDIAIEFRVLLKS